MFDYKREAIFHLNFYFYEMFSVLTLPQSKRCFDMLLIDSFYTQREDKSDLGKDCFFVLHTSLICPS
jgi:hypothetical protein